MPWLTCSAAKQTRQLGTRKFWQAAGRGTDAMAKVDFNRAHPIHVFTELSTDPKAFLPSRIPAPPPSVVVRACSRQHLRSHHRNFHCIPFAHQLSMVVAGTGNFAVRSLLHSALCATAFHRPRRTVFLIRKTILGTFGRVPK